MMKSSFSAVAALVAWAATSASGAQIGAGSTPDGGAFAGACAGTFLSSRPNPGVSYANFAPNGLTCNTSTTSVGTTATASSSGSGTYNNVYPYSNSGTATASTGILRLGSVSDGSSASAFSGAIAEAGFNDRVTLGGGSGSGYWYLPVHVSGMMTATGLGSLGVFHLGLYKNDAIVTHYNGGTAYTQFASLNAHNYGAGSENTEAEMMEYKVQNYGPNQVLTTASLAVNNVTWFVIPVTFGVSFEYALYANAWSGQISSGPFSGQNQTEVHFGHTVSYAGGAYFVGANNTTITNLTYTSASGFDYQNPAIAPVPEPSTWLLAGLPLLLFAKRLTRRSVS